MKTVYLIRHAKSSWKKPVSDFQRGLNKRGKRDLPFMASLIKAKQLNPDVIYASPAKRARKTADKIASELEDKVVSYDENIYEASYQDLLKLIHALDNSLHEIFIVGHNPGLNMLAEFLTGKYIKNIPTAAVYGMEFKVNDWRDVGKACGSEILFEYPKKYLNKDDH
ncbi:MAG: SixA phosphatase family protein [Campylobacterota bacterium]